MKPVHSDGGGRHSQGQQRVVIQANRHHVQSSLGGGFVPVASRAPPPSVHGKGAPQRPNNTGGNSSRTISPVGTPNEPSGRPMLAQTARQSTQSQHSQREIRQNAAAIRSPSADAIPVMDIGRHYTTSPQSRPRNEEVNFSSAARSASPLSRGSQITGSHIASGTHVAPPRGSLVAGGSHVAAPKGSHLSAGGGSHVAPPHFTAAAGSRQGESIAGSPKVGGSPVAGTGLSMTGPTLHGFRQALASQSPQLGRMNELESELLQFTSKMDEMRKAASSLQQEVRSRHRSESVPPQTHTPSSEADRSSRRLSAGVMSGSTGATPSSATVQRGTEASSLNSEGSCGSGSWMVESVKKALLREASLSRSTGRPIGMSELAQELRLLRQELSAESEARKRACSSIEVLVQDERKQMDEMIRSSGIRHEEGITRLEQRWHTTMKEETALRRAVESHLEARLGAMQREVRLEVASATNQSSKVLSDFDQLRDSLRRELDSQKEQISSASADLARLIDQLKNEVHSRSLDGEQSTVDVLPSAELITESLVRAEVRKQLAERSTQDAALSFENNSGNLLSSASSSEQQAVASRLDKAEKALSQEAASREESSSKLLATLHELIAEGRQTLQRGQQEMEQRLQAKLEAASAEARSAQQDCQHEQRQRKEAIENEVKEREEVCFMLLKSLEDKICLERKGFDEKLQEERARLEETIGRHEREVEKQVQSTLETTVGKFVEKNAKELLTTRQDLVELREELQDSLRSEREAREQAVARSGQSAPAQSRVEGVDWQKMTADHAKLRDEIRTDLDRVRSELRFETSARKEDVQSVRSSLDRIREQTTSSNLGPAARLPAEAVSEARAEELHAAIEAEKQQREKADESFMDSVRELLRDERQSRERDHQALDLRLQSGVEQIFVENGKREERDNDIHSHLSKLDEEVDAVKRKLTGSLPQRQRLDELQQSHNEVERRVSRLEERREAEPSTVEKLPRRSHLSMSVGSNSFFGGPVTAPASGAASAAASGTNTPMHQTSRPSIGSARAVNPPIAGHAIIGQAVAGQVFTGQTPKTPSALRQQL